MHWLQKLDQNMRAHDRRIIMLLDNAACHKIPSQLTNITLHFLPARTTAILQPCDAGVIWSFKSQYKKMFIQSRIDAYDKSIADDTNINKFTIKDAIYMIAEAWSGVSQRTVVNCWRKTGILPSVEEANRLEQEQNGFNEETQESTLLQNLIGRLPYGEKLTAEGMFKEVSLYESLKEYYLTLLFIRIY